jgi:hypothetical protein
MFAGAPIGKPADLYRRVRELSPDAEPALAQAIRRLPSEDCIFALRMLARSPDRQVRMDAARAAVRLRDVRFVPDLISMLGERDTRAEARAALVAIGAPALGALDRALGDATLPERMRQHIPRTISRFEPRAATRVLLAHLAQGHDEIVHYKLLRGLGRLRAENPRVRIDRALVARAIESEVETAYRLLHWRVVIAYRAALEPNSEELELLLALLDDKQHKAVERVFRLVGILHPRDHLEHIYRGLHSSDRRAHASGWELLGSIVRGPLRASLLALLDDIPDEDRLQSAAPYYDLEPMSYEECLSAIVRDWDDETLRALALSADRAADPADHEQEAAGERLGLDATL